MSLTGIQNTNDVGVHCDSSNALHVDFTSFLRFNCKVMFLPWERGMTWRNTSDDSEAETGQHLKDPGIPFSFFVCSQEAQPWLASIPEDLINKLEQFDTMFSGVTFPLLAFMSQSNRAKELFESSPALMGLIQFAAKYHQWSFQDILEISQKKRKEILAACGIAGDKLVQRVLSKLSIKMFGMRDYQCLINFNWAYSGKLLSHINYVDMKLLHFISQKLEFSKARFLLQYHSLWNWSNFKLIINDSESMARRLAITNITDQINRCKNLNELNRLHDRLIEQLNRRSIKDMPLIEFPEPPIEGNESIIPIRNNIELMIEGKKQRHCVASYENAVMDGVYYVYRLLEPERATVGLNIRSDDSVFVNQIKLVCNGTASNETKQVIADWIKNRGNLRV